VSPAAPYRLENLERDLLTVMQRARPTVVIAPVDFDRHPDHRVTAWIVTRAAPSNARRLGYLVHAPGFPTPFLLRRGEALVPPKREKHHAWQTCPLSRRAETRKHQVLERYRTQRVDPYLFLLTDAFVRTNELFVLEGPRS
jgi:LmbE family N-acetylglucosaminyl deacetylase